jgi:hypothetical protein
VHQSLKVLKEYHLDKGVRFIFWLFITSSSLLEKTVEVEIPVLFALTLTFWTCDLNVTSCTGLLSAQVLLMLDIY